MKHSLFEDVSLIVFLFRTAQILRKTHRIKLENSIKKKAASSSSYTSISISYKVEIRICPLCKVLRATFHFSPVVMAYTQIFRWLVFVFLFAITQPSTDALSFLYSVGREPRRAPLCVAVTFRFEWQWGFWEEAIFVSTFFVCKKPTFLCKK